MAEGEEGSLVVEIHPNDDISVKPPLEEDMTDLQMALYACVARLITGDKTFMRKQVAWYLNNDVEFRYCLLKKPK